LLKTGQSKDRNRRARKKRGFSSEPDANASIKLSRNAAVRRKEDNPADFHTEASRLEFSFNELPVHLIARSEHIVQSIPEFNQPGQGLVIPLQMPSCAWE
jgi:hypothetical protein